MKKPEKKPEKELDKTRRKAGEKPENKGFWRKKARQKEWKKAGEKAGKTPSQPPNSCHSIVHLCFPKNPDFWQKIGGKAGRIFTVYVLRQKLENGGKAGMARVWEKGGL